MTVRIARGFLIRHSIRMRQTRRRISGRCQVTWCMTRKNRSISRQESRTNTRAPRSTRSSDNSNRRTRPTKRRRSIDSGHHSDIVAKDVAAWTQRVEVEPSETKIAGAARRIEIVAGVQSFLTFESPGQLRVRQRIQEAEHIHRDRRVFDTARHRFDYARLLAVEPDDEPRNDKNSGIVYAAYALGDAAARVLLLLRHNQRLLVGRLDPDEHGDEISLAH